MTLEIQLDDHGVMDQAIDRRGSDHGVFENLLPFGERQVAAQEHTPAFVPLGQQREQDFHLFAALLDIAGGKADRAALPDQLVAQGTQ